MSIFTNLENDFETFWETKVKPFLHTDVEPVLKAFVKQFDSKFGAEAIAAALGAVASLEVPGANFGDIAAGLAVTLFNDAKKDAANTATLDATQVLQTIQSALSVAKVVNNVVTPSDVAAVTAINAGS